MAKASIKLHGEGACPHAPQAGRAVAPRPPPLVRLGEVCLSITDGSHNPPAGVQDSAYLMLSSKNVYDDSITLDEPRFLTERQFLDEDKRTRISSGDVLFTIVGTVGRAAVVPNAFPKICLQRSVAVLKPNTKLITSRFLMYQLQAMRSFFEQQARGVAQKGIYLKQLSACVLNALPPLPEQKRIAAILDKICEMKRNAEARLQKLDLLVKARFVEMFGDVLTNPKGWARDILERHIDVLAGFPFDSTNYVEDGGVKICGGLIIMHRYLDWSNCKRWKNTDGVEAYLLQANDIVMALDRPWVSTGFKIAQIEEKDLPALLIQRTARIRGIDVDQRFLMSLLADKAFEAHCTVTGSLVPHISHKDIKSYEVILPPLALQRQFAAFVEKVEEFKATAKKELEQVDLLYRAKLQEFFG